MVQLSTILLVSAVVALQAVSNLAAVIPTSDTDSLVRRAKGDKVTTYRVARGADGKALPVQKVKTKVPAHADTSAASKQAGISSGQQGEDRVSSWRKKVHNVE